MVNENGEEVPVNPQGGGGALGGAMGFAQGFMAKAAAAGEGIKAKAGGLGGIQVWAVITFWPAVHWQILSHAP